MHRPPAVRGAVGRQEAAGPSRGVEARPHQPGARAARAVAEQPQPAAVGQPDARRGDVGRAARGQRLARSCGRAAQEEKRVASWARRPQLEEACDGRRERPPLILHLRPPAVYILLYRSR